MKGIIHNTRVVGVKKRHSQDDTDAKTDDKLLETSGAPFNNMENGEVARSIENCRLSLPALTVTVPSLEELSPKPSSSNIFLDAPQRSIDDNGQQSNPNQVREQVSDLSPPIHRKSSKWFKVKNVFLPSGNTVRASNSAPCSPVRSDSFIYEVESDDISSGEFMDEAHKLPSQSYDEFNRGRNPPTLHQEIQEDYRRLQRRLGEEFKRKAKDWELRRRSCGLQSSGNSSVVIGEEASGQDNLTAEFRKKLEEWDRIKGSHSPDWDQSSKMNNPFEPDMAPWARYQQRNARKKPEGSKEPGERRPFLSERWKKYDRSGGSPTEQKSVKRGAKELAWLEKELLKIEREKQRLDREREKFNQREARLKKMRLAVGSGMRKQEVLIPTSTGMFRFQGISQKFTRKLYEWEIAQGIRPEASTFALLDPGYKLSLSSSSHTTGENGKVLVRSKSVGSVAELGGSSSNPEGITHQPSSLSLNDMDGLEGGCLHDEEEVPEAIIVDLEDVSEGTDLVANSQIIRQTPVYCYAPEEVTRLINSSERKLEHDMEHLEGQINDVSKSFENELERMDEQSKNEHIMEIRTRMGELDQQKEELQIQEVTLKDSYFERQWIDEVFQIPMLLTNKIFELRKVLDCLGTVSEYREKSYTCLLDDDSEGSLPDRYRTMERVKDFGSNPEYPDQHDKERDNECSSPASSFTFQPVSFKQSGHHRKPSVWEWEKLGSDKMIVEESQQNYEDDDNSTTLSRDEEKQPNFSDFDYYSLGQLKGDEYMANEDSSHEEATSEIEAECHPPPLPPVPDDFGYYTKRIRVADIQEGSFEERTDEDSSSGGCRSPDDRYKNPAMNVFVPTTRKIFSPVYLEETGETASVVEIIVKDGQNDTKEEECKPSGRWEGRRGWSFRERAQSASPAVLRRTRKSSLSSLSRASPQPGRRHLSCIKLNPSYAFRLEEGTSDSTGSSDNFTAKTETSAEKNVGIDFPPISPVCGRKEIEQASRESPASLRMIMEKYNRKMKDGEYSTGASVGWRSPQSKGEQRNDYRQEIRGILGSRTASAGAIRGACQDSAKIEEKLSIITKSSSVGAIGSYSTRQDNTRREEATESRNEITTEEADSQPVVFQTIEEDGVPTPESLRLRAMKIKRAKEEFLQRGLEKDLPPWQEEGELPECASIVVSQERLNELGSSVLVVKSVVEEPTAADEARREGDVSPSKGHWGRLKWPKILKRIPKNGRSGAVSALCRQSLVVDIQSDKSSGENLVKSCPSSPVLARPSRSEEELTPTSSSSSWIKNPAKIIFRPKGKYTINNK
ncbi:hypothetical protein AAG570_002489 [Ranatra chinensis]|uniref:Uncharacterized protein n=1 Tax=Ranatra chinensis TaxID=642074 RepID=A0ABD0Y9S1_9HEMI